MSDTPYTQKPLLDALHAGHAPNVAGSPTHVETVQSNVFLFEHTAYKVYKNDNEFFNANMRDLSSREERHAFTQEDFAWNAKLSPTVYKKLLGVRIEKDTVQYDVPLAQADELVMVMRRLYQKDVLLGKLFRGEVSAADCHNIGKQLATRLTAAQSIVPNVDYAVHFKKLVSDLRDFIHEVPEHISTAESDSYIDYLEQLPDREADWFKNILSKEVMTDGDFHTDNCVLENGTLQLIDTYAPRHEWTYGHRLTAMYRIGADIWAISESKAYFDAYVIGYEEGSATQIDRRLDTPLLLYGALIMVSYLYMLSRTNPEKLPLAQKFHQFVKNLHNNTT